MAARGQSWRRRTPRWMKRSRSCGTGVPGHTSGSARRLRTSSPRWTWLASRRCSALSPTRLRRSAPRRGGGGGAALESGRVWVADPLDGTINYASGSPLCGETLGLLDDGVPMLGVIDSPFLGVRVDSGAVADVNALEEGIIGMGDAFHRGGARTDAYLELTATMHRRALRFRCVGAASVLWAWLVDGQIQGMLWPTTTRTTSSRACDRPRGGSDRPRLRRRAADSGVGREPWRPSRHPARARQPRRRSCGGSARQLRSHSAMGRTHGTWGLCAARGCRLHRSVADWSSSLPPHRSAWLPEAVGTEAGSPSQFICRRYPPPGSDR